MTGKGWQRASPWLLAGVLGVAGVAHFVIAERYERTIPAALPYPREIVYVSGAAELLCAGGLMIRRTRRLAGWATAALFVIVFPANVQMAMDARGGTPAHQLVSWGRLPLQVPLVLWAAQVARSEGRLRSRMGRAPAG